MINHQEIEKQLIPRLRKLGFILMAFSVVALASTLLPEEEQELTVSEESFMPDFEETPPLNMYIVAMIFASVGAGCITIAWKKKKNLIT